VYLPFSVAVKASKTLRLMAENQEKSNWGGWEVSGTSDLEARRAFLKGCAKYAVAMPPAVTLLLSANPVSSFHGPATCSFTICPNPSEDPKACHCDEETAPLSGDSNLLSPEEIEFLQN
jgi:hypothetical protein